MGLQKVGFKLLMTKQKTDNSWYVYLLTCADDSLYCGITTDIERRLRQHNGEIKGGARYTQARRPVNLAWLEVYQNRSQASVKEYQIKRLSARSKQDLCRNSSIPQNLKSSARRSQGI